MTATMMPPEKIIVFFAIDKKWTVCVLDDGGHWIQIKVTDDSTEYRFFNDKSWSVGLGYSEIKWDDVETFITYERGFKSRPGVWRHKVKNMKYKGLFKKEWTQGDGEWRADDYRN